MHMCYVCETHVWVCMRYWASSSTYLQYIPIEWRSFASYFVTFGFIRFFLCCYCYHLIWQSNNSKRKQVCLYQCRHGVNAQPIKLVSILWSVRWFVNAYLTNDPINIKMPVIDKQNRYPLVLPFSTTRILGAVYRTPMLISLWCIDCCWLIAHVK